MTPQVSFRRLLRRPRLLAAAGGVALVAGASLALWVIDRAPTVPIKLDMEQRTDSGSLLNPSTQSLNRYQSVLRELDRVEVRLSGGDKLALELHRPGGSERVAATDLDIRFLVPLLSYPHDGGLDGFDAANLMLAEYARNGIQLSYQEANTHFGVFHASADVFDGEDEYYFEGGEVRPNPRVRPKRLNVTNNCLAPGLWEISASDSVGEMYHSWFDMPRATYLEMVRRANGLRVGDDEIESALQYRKDFGPVPLDLDRLRSRGRSLAAVEPEVALDKQIGGYSTQDSRRKVQRGYFSVVRDGQAIAPASFADLRRGDAFRLHAFIPPGIYTVEDPQIVPYDPDWDLVEIFEVEPATRYRDQSPSAGELGHVEIVVHSADRQRSLVVGNVPVALLVAQADYEVPAFGAGVFPPSEPIEQRYLRLLQGPRPHYAYLAERAPDGWRVLNNHELGLEQVFLRPVEEEGRLWLRLTLVAYERIVDLLELRIPIEGDLADRVREATRSYTPPLYRVYRDENIL